MADIELVIKIDEEDYKKVLESNNRDYEWNDMCTCYEAVFKGTPLPKEYGRLIDANVIKDLKNKIKHYGKDYKFTQEEILNILERYEIKYAPTIVEADKEG